MISIAIDNGRNNTVGGGCYSVDQAVSKFAEHNIDMVSEFELVVSGDVNKMLECVSKFSDSKFSDRKFSDSKFSDSKFFNILTVSFLIELWYE